MNTNTKPRTLTQAELVELKIEQTKARLQKAVAEGNARAEAQHMRTLEADYRRRAALAA